MKNFFILISVLIFAGIAGCVQKRFQKSPVDNFIKDLNNEPVFSIILHDMDVEGTFSKTYKHQYKIITEEDSVPKERITGWYEVDEYFFNKHIDNMGMEIAAKTRDGKITKTPAPPGYTNYVGNSQYGHWVSNNQGNSFWEFYGKFAFISSIFNLMGTPVYRNNYMDYSRNYRGRRAYYGPKTATGSRYYGTGGRYTKNTRSGSRWYSKSSNQAFRNRVRNRVSPSSRSGSRYSRSGSFRSRSGGFGK